MRERALRFLSLTAYNAENILVQWIQNSTLIHPESNPVKNNVDMRNAILILSSHDKARKKSEPRPLPQISKSKSKL